ncbi:hypothetical protein [Streptomyces sp. NPDC052225]|uniref:hypothetical protein n=1 Tax=Streptomyces sp. NPDC052225 TaxID=3154949 RepID=UPI00343E92DC
MFRGGRQGRGAVALFVAVLLALPFFTAAHPFAPAHTHERSVSAVDCTDAPAPVEGLRFRDRQRGAQASPGAPCPHVVSVAADTVTPPDPSPHGDARLRPTRSSRALTAAALQVFRC